MKTIKVRLLKPTYTFLLGKEGLEFTTDVHEYDGDGALYLVEASVEALKAAGADGAYIEDGDGYWPFIIGADVEVVTGDN